MPDLTKLAIVLCLLFIALGTLENFPWRSDWNKKGISIEMEPGYPYTLNLRDKDRSKLNQFHILHRVPFGQKGVALVGEDSSGNFFLNPKGFTSGSFQFDFGDIPENPKLTKAQTVKLWGKPASSNSDYETYELSTEYLSAHKTNVKPNFYIDAKFEKNALKAYRLRGKNIHTDWTSTDTD